MLQGHKGRSSWEKHWQRQGVVKTKKGQHNQIDCIYFDTKTNNIRNGHTYHQSEGRCHHTPPEFAEHGLGSGFLSPRFDLNTVFGSLSVTNKLPPLPRCGRLYCLPSCFSLRLGCFLFLFPLFLSCFVFLKLKMFYAYRGRHIDWPSAGEQRFKADG